MNILIFYSTSTLFFFQISTLCLYPFWKSLSLSNYPCNIALSTFTTFVATSYTYFGVLVYVIRSLDCSIDDLSFYTILLPSSNPNGNLFADFGLLGGTCSLASLNSSKAGCVTILIVYSLVACRPSCVYYCCYCNCCSKCCKCCGLVIVSIQLSCTFTSKCKCSSPSRNLMPCSFLTSWFCSLSCFTYGNVICGTSCLYSLSYVSYGVIICGIFNVYLTAYTTVGTIDGSTLPLIIFCALKFVLFCSLFSPKPKDSPFSTLFFFLITLLGKFVAVFFLLSSVVCISSQIL